MKSVIDKLKKVDKSTIIRTVTLILAIANEIVAVIGASSFANHMWYQILSLSVLCITSVVNAWENNDWTFFARVGTAVLDALEDGKVTIEEVQEILDKSENEK